MRTRHRTDVIVADVDAVLEALLRLRLDPLKILRRAIKDHSRKAVGGDLDNGESGTNRGIRPAQSHRPGGNPKALDAVGAEIAADNAEITDGDPRDQADSADQQA
jgi:hypothetical protein